MENNNSEQKATSQSDGSIDLTPEEQIVFPQVQKFIVSETYADKEELIREFPDLMSAPALSIMEKAAAGHAAIGDQASADTLIAFKEMLELSREIGAHAAVQQHMILQVLNRFLVEFPELAGSDSPFDTIDERYPELLRPEADDLLARFGHHPVIEVLRDLLKSKRAEKHGR